MFHDLAQNVFIIIYCLKLHGQGFSASGSAQSRRCGRSLPNKIREVPWSHNGTSTCDE
jgi:hypothetical protein